MKKASLILVMLSTICISAFSQVKKQYADSNEHGTTVVVKEDGTSDVDILNSYGDNYSMGDVIRITTEMLPPTSTIEQKEEPLVLTQTATTKEVAGQEDFPEEVRPRRVIKKRPLSVRKPRPVRAFVPPTPAKITMAHSASPSEFRSEALFNKKKGKKKRNKKRGKKRLFKSKKGSSCYRF